MVRVASIEKSLDFYCGLLGMKEIRRVENEKGKFTLVFLAANGDENQARENTSPLLELTYNWGSSEVYESGRNFGHLAFRVENIYDTCQHLSDNGVTINRPPRDGYMAFVKSPDGISIELLQEGERLSPSEPWLSMPSEGTW